MVIPCLAVAAAVLAFQSTATAPAAAPTSPHDGRNWGVVYEVPAMKKVVERLDVPYSGTGQNALTIDLVYPEKPAAGKRWPAVVFVNGVGDEPGERKLKQWEIYRSWAKLVAAHGLVGINMETRSGACDANLRDLFTHVRAQAAALSIDPERLALYCCSANVGTGLPFAMSDAAVGLRAALVFYGAADVPTLRRDVHVLFVVAGRDGPYMLGAARRLQALATEQMAPWTVRFEPELPHAFDAFDAGVVSRRVVKQAVEFLVAELTEPPPPASGNPPARQGLAAVYGNDPERAVAIYRDFVAKDPHDQEAQASLGRNLVFSGHAADAVAPLQAALALGADDPGVHQALGQALQAAGDDRGAIPHLANAAEHMERQGFHDSQLLGALGFASLMVGDAQAGVQYYERAFAAGIPPGPAARGLAAFNLACGYARLHRADDAFPRLDEAFENGALDAQRLSTDSDLAALRSDARFAALLARTRARRNVSASGVADPPGAPDAAVAALLARADEALDGELADAQGLLADPGYLPAHEFPAFREQIRDHAPTGAITFVTGNEPGERLVVLAHLKDAQGRPVPDALVYVYQTSARGWYSADAPHIGGNSGDEKHARLFAYVKSDAQGNFTLRTIRPSGYPASTLPAHLHVEIDPDDPSSKSSTWVSEIQFADDPRLTAAARAESQRQGFVIADVNRDEQGLLQTEVTFTLR